MTTSNVAHSNVNERDETRTLLLDETIAEAENIQNAVPTSREATAVKEVASLISALLSAMKVSMDTPVKDTEGLVLRCSRAVQVLRATAMSNEDGDTTTGFLTDAKLAELKTLLLRISQDITSPGKRTKMRRRFCWPRVASTSINKNKMDEWISGFDSVLSQTPPVDSGSTTVQNGPLDRLDNPDHSRPRPLFGRTDLLEEITSTLFVPHHILLHGPGGSGKTAISEAILDEPAIREKYKERRFLIEFDDIDSFQMTHELFINRLSRHVLVDAVHVAKEWHIMNFLKLGDVLLVLDSMDSLVDAPSPDRDLILDSLTEFGALPNVAIVMTTSQSTEPPPGLKLPCIIYHIPPLPPPSIHDAFRLIYKADNTALAAEWLSMNNITNALAVTILAHTAHANKWTADQLRDAWDTTHARLSAGKLIFDRPQDFTLACAVHVSLNAPSAKCFRSDVRRAFAFLAILLPQGLLQQPVRVAASINSPDPIGLVDVLVKHGLFVPRGEFYVIHPCIRRYMRETVPPGRLDAEFLKQAKGPYSYILTEIDERAAAFVREDVNTESVVVFDLANLHLPDVQLKQACVHVAKFTEALIKYKPRATCLRTILPTLAHRLLTENDDIEQGSRMDLEPLMKALTFTAAYHLAIGDYVAAVELFGMAHDVARAQNEGTVAMECITHQADAYRILGKYQTAKELIEQVQQSDLWAHGNPPKWGLACWVLSMSRLQMEVKPESDRQHGLFSEAIDNFKQETATEYSWKVARALSAFMVGAVDGDWSAARVLLDEWLDSDTDIENHGPYFYGLVPIAFMQGQLEEARRHLCRAREWCRSKKGGQLQTHRTLVEEALIASHRGQFQHATDMLGHAALSLEEISSKHPSPVNESLVLYASALNALFAHAHANANELADARTRFERVREVCARRGEVHLRAQSTRALGEIAALEGHGERAEMWFGECVGLCGMMGVPPSLLYRCHVLRDLGDRFRGWGEYLGEKDRDGQLSS